MDAGLGVAAVEHAGDRSEAELAAALVIEEDVAGAEQIDERAVPQLHLGDAPFAGQRMGHVGASSSLGNRTAAAKVKAQSTLASPRSFVLRRPATVLIPPNASSIRLRMRWLAAYPAWRVVRPSIAERRPLVLRATCGRTLSSRSFSTKSAAS